MARRFLPNKALLFHSSRRHVIRRFLLGGLLAHKIHCPAHSVILRLFGCLRFFCPIRPRACGSSLDARPVLQRLVHE